MDKKKINDLYYTIDPVKSPEAIELKGKLLAVYTRIKAKAYFVTNDVLKLMVNEKGLSFKYDHVPIALIVAFLVNKSSTLLEGPPSSGKTKIIKIISRMMTGSSINDVSNIVYCNEEMSQEKWMAYPDVKRMINAKMPSQMAISQIKTMLRNETPVEEMEQFLDAVFEQDGGRFDVIWSELFSKPDTLTFIIDEINRANPRTQNELLSFMAEGIVQYAVPARKKISDFRIFFTQNPLDDIMGGGNIFPLNHAFKDRITQYIQVSRPPGYAMKMVSEVRTDDRNYEYDEDKEIKQIMSVDDVRAATILASKMKVTNRAKRYARYLCSDVGLCLRAPKFDKSLAKTNIAGRGLCDGCHFCSPAVTNYHCQKFFGGSMRMYNDLIAVGKSYAFFLGIDEVNEYLLRSIAVDVIVHRVLILPDKLREDNQYGNDPAKFLKAYLIDWCFSKLVDREMAEEAYERLYSGTGENPEMDIRTMVNMAQNDLYVHSDLLSRIIEIDGDVSNLKEKSSKIVSTTNTDKYRNLARKITAVDIEQIPIDEKRQKLKQLTSEVVSSSIPFSSNLIDMIYAIYPKIQLARKIKRIGERAAEQSARDDEDE